MIRTVFFDLDGTLIDTELAAANAIAAGFREWNHVVEPSDAQYITGRTWEKAFDFLFEKYPPPMPRECAAEVCLDRYRAELKKGLIEVPGAVECVRRLAGEFPLALISGSHRREILFALDQLGIRDRFQVILGAEDYPNSKPAPDGYRKALAMLGARGEETLVFEDSEAGIRSGIAAGLKVCAVTSTNHFGLSHEHAHWRVEDLRGVDAAWVRGLQAD